MVDQNLMTLKVRSYLGALSRNACDMLIRNLEASRERGDEDPQADLILEAARPLMRNTATNDQPRAHRRNLLKRVVFLPLEPYLVVEALPRKLPGRIRRSRLDAIWTWLERDVLTERIAEAQETLAREDYDVAVVETVANDVREAVVNAIAKALDEANGPGVARQRMAFRVGGEEVLVEMADILGILRADVVLEGFVAQLPPILTRTLFETRANILDAIKVIVDAYPDHAGWVAAILLWKSDNPALLARIASRGTGSVKPQTIADTPYAAMIELLLCELRRCALMAAEAVRSDDEDEIFHGEVWRNEALVVAVQRYRDLVSDLRSGLELGSVPEWREEMLTANRDMARMIADEVAQAHRHVREALQVPEADAEGRVALDKHAMAAAQRALRVFAIAWKNPDQLAVSDAVKRGRQSIEQVLDMACRSLVDDLRTAVGTRREALKEALEAAISYCEIVFGGEYVQTLKKRRDALLDAEKRPLAS